MLGTGGFGEVWKAENELADGPTVFKFFLDPHARSRFSIAEARNLQDIHKQAATAGVVRLLAAEPKQDPPWLQLEFIDGGDLSGVLAEWRGMAGLEHVRLVHGTVHDLCRIVGHFHRLPSPVIHRDLKPANVLRRSGGQLVVADFGISKVVPPEREAALRSTPSVKSLGTVAGYYTQMYASPQQKRQEKADRRDDVFSLGVIWYQLLVGDLSAERPGGTGWDEDLLALGMSEPAVKILGRCLADRPERRPADAGELADLLDGCPEGGRRAREEAERRQRQEAEAVALRRRSQEAERKEAQARLRDQTIRDREASGRKVIPVVAEIKALPEKPRGGRKGDRHPLWAKAYLSLLVIALGIGLIYSIVQQQQARSV